MYFQFNDKFKTAVDLDAVKWTQLVAENNAIYLGVYSSELRVAYVDKDSSIAHEDYYRLVSKLLDGI